MRHHQAAFENHFGDITQAQFGAQPPQDREEDDVRREFKRGKGSPSSFIGQCSSLRQNGEISIPEMGSVAKKFKLIKIEGVKTA